MSTPPAPAPAKPLPVIEGYTEEFYGWCKKHELRFQQCANCHTFRHPPRPMCAKCHSLDWRWAPVRGTGTIHTWTTIHRALHPAFTPDTPYAAVIVELDEGVRLATQVTGLAPDQLSFGMPVQVWFDDVTDQVTLPKFKKAEAQ